MIDYSRLETQLAQAIGLTRRPVAVTFSDHPPAGVPKFSGSMPSGCSFWRLAGDGRTFYTVPSDHFALASATVRACLATFARSLPGITK